MGARPILRAGDEVLLDSMTQQIVESSDLSLLFAGDDDHLVAASPERASPIVNPPNLFGEVRLEEGHEESQLLRRLGREQEVQVVRQDHEAVDGHPVASLRSPENPQGDVVELWRRSQQQPSLHRAAGDLDHRPFRNET